ncbi:DnaJ domain-containing protein [uncultured Lacinutrix sp.]|uniref:DnaJ domain-containing protein n=1 Tax=uncultured Lacinutrix sp. TaxID=574032 RepID=UPI002620C235|nr:DnaJ domain-containing protein [uncultured Lacinutrix sp.]
MTVKNYYELLGISSTSNLEDIKKAFRREIAIYHPDINTSKNAEKRFDDLVEAFDILSKPDKRKLYDALLKNNNTLNSTASKKVIKKHDTFQEWRKEAKQKATDYKSKNPENTPDFELLTETVIEGFMEILMEGAGDLFEDFFDGF